MIYMLSLKELCSESCNLSSMAIIGTSSFSAIPIFLCCFLLWPSQAMDTLKPGEYLRESESETLVSSNGVFELGFFSSSSTNKRYLGIWFKNDPNKKPVWVANRDSPILDSFGNLSIRYGGNLVIMDSRQIPIIVNSGMLATSNNTSVTLLDSGNLVLREGYKIVWQSFYSPSDTFLPGMKLGWFGLGTEHLRRQYLVSWQTQSDPTLGSFVLGLDSYNRTQLNVFPRDGVSLPIGHWDGQRMKFLFESFSDDYNFSYVSKPDEIYLTFSTRKNDSSSWFVISSTGQIQEYKLSGEKISMVTHSICENTTASNATDCFLTMPSMCQDGDKFSEIIGSMPNSIVLSDSVHLGTSDCEIFCRGNCSCTAFAAFRDDGSGCKVYYGDKEVLLSFIGEGRDSIYVRGDNSTKSDQQKKRGLRLLVIIIPVVSLIVLIIVALICYLRWRNHGCRGWMGNQDRGSVEQFLFQIGSNVPAVDKENHELPQLSFSCIATATANFSDANKLGEGGFGSVYKGMLEGHEIAVKRLSRRSGQGFEEFKNEVQLISKLQHRNLVRLLGCCIQREEKILVYEYMANKSLDSFLFDPSKRKLLDWKKRVIIIEGIAQGLLYLHKYSRFRIIHRDLKPSNILLDAHMNPKISDFGMARIFGDDEAWAKTTRVVGTYGYMSPEYAVQGIFSIKSDVFSFGVIILEIISGRKNVTFCYLDHSWNLLGYAWYLWKDGKGLELMDPTLANSCSMSEFMLCIQVGLLCVQERAEDRPTMSDVISLLSNESTNLPAPKQPAFSTHINYSNSQWHQSNSVNDVTLSDTEAR